MSRGLGDVYKRQDLGKVMLEQLSQTVQSIHILRLVRELMGLCFRVHLLVQSLVVVLV